MVKFSSNKIKDLKKKDTFNIYHLHSAVHNIAINRLLLFPWQIWGCFVAVRDLKSELAGLSTAPVSQQRLSAGANKALLFSAAIPIDHLH